MADHLFRNRLVQIDRVRAVGNFLLATNIAGELLVCTYERAENIVAWTPFRTQGEYQSLAVIPNFCNTGEEIWTSVKRVINGVTKFYVEFLDSGMNVDCGVFYSGASTATITGLSHLNGATVVGYVEKADSVQGAFDGVVTSETAVVSGGSVTLANAGVVVHVGLGYKAHLRTLRLDTGVGETGTQ